MCVCMCVCVYVCVCLCVCVCVCIYIHRYIYVLLVYPFIHICTLCLNAKATRRRPQPVTRGRRGSQRAGRGTRLSLHCRSGKPGESPAICLVRQISLVQSSRRQPVCVCVCACVCVCMHVSMYVCMYVHTHTHNTNTSQPLFLLHRDQFSMETRQFSSVTLFLLHRDIAGDLIQPQAKFVVQLVQFSFCLVTFVPSSQGCRR